MKAVEKYNKLRQELKTGDIVLFHRKSLLANIIQWADNSYYNHASIVYWLGDRLFTVDAWDNGTEIVPLSRRIKQYDDFCIVRKNNITPQELRFACSNLISRIEKDEPYGWLELVRRLIWLKVLNKNNKFSNIENWIAKKRLPVCSDVAREFGVDLGIVSYKSLILPTPEDLKRHAQESETTVLWHDHKDKL